MSKKLKMCIAVVIACIIIAGIIVTLTIGLNFDLIYSKNKQVTISIDKEFDIEDIRNIVKEVTGQNKMILEKIELYEDMVSIKLADITDEQLNELNTKINEKYELENTVEDLTVVENTNIRGRDIVRPYIFPACLSFILIIVYLAIYMLIKSKLGIKINISENLVNFILSIVFVQGLFLGLVAILRIPVNRLTMPISLGLYVLTTIVFMCKLENKYKRVENEKK